MWQSSFSKQKQFPSSNGKHFHCHHSRRSCFFLFDCVDNVVFLDKKMRFNSIIKQRHRSINSSMRYGHPHFCFHCCPQKKNTHTQTAVWAHHSYISVIQKKKNHLVTFFFSPPVALRKMKHEFSKKTKKNGCCIHVDDDVLKTFESIIRTYYSKFWTIN